jgi:methylated-DNA-[protein]-cysteine S-methyltransferase
MVAHLTVGSPVGRLFIAASDAGLRVIETERPRHAAMRGPDWEEGDSPILAELRRQLDAYFAGKLRDFDLPLDPQGTDFQQKVWRALRDIPYGEACSYLDIARRLGDPNATRAVGAANGRNPISIVVPCHRVIGADGSLTGYGGGLGMKRFLLELEGVLPPLLT